MDRRDFLKLMGVSGLTAVAPLAGSSVAQAGEYDGPFYITVAADGGWDPTSFCDPKMNVSGELEINHWARTSETQTAGNINYAPYASNENFFQRFYRHMLVVNGVDSQTNSHEAGVIHTWSGRLAPGLPTFTSLAAAIGGPDLPIAYINTGGYRETAGLIRYSYINEPNILRTMLLPNSMEQTPDVHYFNETDLDTLQQYQLNRIQTLMDKNNLMPQEKTSMSHLYMARNSMSQLKAFADNLPEELVDDYDEFGNYSPIRGQGQLALTAYYSGMTVSADLMLGGFDTHEDHDEGQAGFMSGLTDGVTYLFDYAGELGISDKLIVLIGSDFGRTPFYNEDNGKDHWPIGSVVFMQENASWGNRVVGATDGGHNALAINPTTLAVDSSNGTIIYPKHVQDGMRRLAAIDQDAITLRYNLGVDESFDFFNLSIST